MSDRIDIMLDIETLGTTPGCIVLAAGLVVIRNNEIIYDSGEIVFNYADSLASGFESNPETEAWWEAHDGVPQHYWNQPRHHVSTIGQLRTIVKIISGHIEQFGASEEVLYWSRGHFDYPILSVYFNEYGMQPPWEGRHRQMRDLRTALDVLQYDITGEPKYHRANLDAVQQAEQLVKARHHFFNR